MFTQPLRYSWITIALVLAACSSEARSSLSDAEANWTKAQDAHAGSDPEQAVTLAKAVQGKLTALAASMKLNFNQPAAVTDTSALSATSRRLSARITL
jgi:hypothetical protein